MSLDLREARARFLLDARRVDGIRRLVDPLKDAPLRIRRLGLSLSVATWSREGRNELNQLLADWLFSGWGMLNSGGVPQNVVAMINRLMEIEDQASLLRSAMEIEAEHFLQTAKVISAALTGD